MTEPSSPSRLRLDGVRRADAVFAVSLRGSAIAVLGVIGAITVFLALRAWPSLRLAGADFFTTSAWLPDAEEARYGVAALAFGTVASSIVAVVIAVPVAVGTSLFMTEVAGARTSRWLGNVVDLLAAVPSVVYGLWGFVYLVPRLDTVQARLDDVLGFIPLFHSRTGAYGRSVFAAGVVLAIMVVPIVAALSRELFRQVPRQHREAAWALGATRWETIRHVVLPSSRPGLVGAVMLGFGRALGETIAVALVLAATYSINIHLVEPGGNTIAANIATKFGEAGENGRSALVASGLVLFVITFAVNAVARLIAMRNERRLGATS